MNKNTRKDLQMLQALPLDVKVAKTKQRIREWVNHYGEDGVYVSFSGGKDSTVLLHLVRELYPNTVAAFCDTGLEYPEIREFVRRYDNVVWLKPKMNFKHTIEKYGYPFISKEVAEAVYGARRYLTKLAEREAALTDRQTDRPVPYEYFYRKVTGTGEYGKSSGNVEGGADNKYRKVTGIGEYSRGHKPVQSATSHGSATKEWEGKTGSYPYSEQDRSRYNCEKYKFLLLDDAPPIGQQCCRIMKKDPAHRYTKETGRKPILGTTASESRLRTQQWIRNGCNGFDMKSPVSTPMAFWTEQDVLRYIKLNNIPIASVYGDIVYDYDDESACDGQMELSDLSSEFGIFDMKTPPLKTTGCSRTGCVFCGFGCHRNGDDRFVMLKSTHPQLYDYIMRPKEQGGLNYKEVIDWINEHGNLHIKY